MQRFASKLKEKDDIALIVLKGHLLIEERLDEIIRNSVVNPTVLKNTRMNFELKCKLAQSMCTKPEFPAWLLVLSLNSLRNDLAHKLESDSRDLKIDKSRNLYIQYLQEGHPFPSDADLSVQIEFLFGSCLGFLIAVNDSILENKLQIAGAMKNSSNELDHGQLISN